MLHELLNNGNEFVDGLWQPVFSNIQMRSTLDFVRSIHPCDGTGDGDGNDAPGFGAGCANR